MTVDVGSSHPTFHTQHGHGDDVRDLVRPYGDAVYARHRVLDRYSSKPCAIDIGRSKEQSVDLIKASFNDKSDHGLERYKQLSNGEGRSSHVLCPPLV